MNRSRQRTAAISWAIAAGVFCAGIAGIAPASADSRPSGDGGSAPVSSAGDRSGPRAGARERVTADLPRSGGVESGRAQVSVPEVSAPGGPEQHWPWPPCHSEWPVPVPVPVPAVAASTNRGIPGVPLPITQPTVTFGPSVSRPDPPGLQWRAALRLRIAERIRERRERSDQALPSGPAPFRPAPLSAPIPPPAAPLKLGPRPAAPTPQPAESPAAQPESNRAGYPTYLRDADLAEVAAVAVPGLVGIFGLTAIGGYLGFRQARAGYILRAAGTARFLR